ncbi:patatin-like phospholipase family protein [Sedimentibacter sp. MB31-C6]|uniref:patatin-like phospholipase family protein n=1 Tax=Sedimentibacter sp. MB31-C6 TaxID=3109366 RepID=UPI002DDCD385|nr:patatin-like phospholipase family protein [Sedimentibacter sp. MB36-C1]WSI04294.1 patatin-like phospholipase family protein [Sedimentibacter sp. MB36-C1]
MDSIKKVGIVLEGGGAKGAYQIGVLKSLKELNIKYDFVVGTSIGAVNGIAYVLGEYEKFSEMWSNLNFSIENHNKSKHSQPLNLKKILNNIDDFESKYLHSEGINPEPIIDLYKKNINENAVRSSNIIYGLTTYNLTDKKTMNLFINDIPEGFLHEFVFASCNLPIFTPKSINGKYYLDGSINSRLPIDMVAKRGCNIIITVRLRPEEYEFSKYNDVKIIDIAPEVFLSNTLEASRDRINWMIEKGYEDSKKILEENLSYLLP